MYPISNQNLFPIELTQGIFKSLKISDFYHFYQVCKKGNAIAKNLIIGRAIEYGYKGNLQAEQVTDIFSRANSHLRNLLKIIHCLAKNKAIPQKNLVYRRIKCRDYTLDREATFRTIHAMPFSLKLGNFLLKSKVPELVVSKAKFESFLTLKPDLAVINSIGITILMRAVTRSYSAEIFKMLLNSDAKKTIHTTNKNGNNVLHYAIKEKRDDLIDLLIEAGAKVTVRNGNGQTLLILAVSSRCSIERVNKLLHQETCEGLNATDNFGWNALQYAVCKNRGDIVQALLEQKGIDKEAMTPEQATPLHLATAYGFVHIVQILLADGANPFAQDNVNRTPRRIAAQWYSDNHKTIAKELKKAEKKSVAHVVNSNLPPK